MKTCSAQLQHDGRRLVEGRLLRKNIDIVIPITMNINMVLDPFCL